MMTTRITPACITALIKRSDIPEICTGQGRHKKAPLDPSRASLVNTLTSRTDDRASRVVAGLRGLRMSRGGGPCLGRAGGDRGGDGHVLRGDKALERRGRRARAGEVRAVVVSGVLLLVGREVAKIGLHRGDIRLVFRVGEL